MKVLQAERLSIAFGGLRAVDTVTLSVDSGQVFSIIGPNGSGKTTLFNLVSGIYRADDGQIWLDGEPVTGLSPHDLARKGLSRTFQNLQIFSRMSVLENVMVGRHRHETTGVLADLVHWPSVTRQNRATRAAAFTALARVGLADHAHRSAGSLAYGEARRLEIARALAGKPSLLLLDEPAAGMNERETEELGDTIRASRKLLEAMVIVEHDVAMMRGLADRLVVMDAGHKIAEGKPGEVLAEPNVIEAYLGTDEADE